MSNRSWIFNMPPLAYVSYLDHTFSRAQGSTQSTCSVSDAPLSFAYVIFSRNLSFAGRFYCRLARIIEYAGEKTHPSSSHNPHVLCGFIPTLEHVLVDGL